MGSLQNFNDACEKIKFLKKVYNSSVFVETGCFRGNTLSYALTLGFDKLYSCDIDQEMIDFCEYKFKGSVSLYLGSSLSFLGYLLPLIKDTESVLFYLDAHLPEHDKNNGTVVLDSEFNFPLQEELELINNFRSDKKDVIICDDLRIYEDGPFQGGNWEGRKAYNLNLDFLNKLNYQVKKYYSQEGYLLLTKEMVV